MEIASVPSMAWPLISHVIVGIGTPRAEQSNRAESPTDTVRLFGRRCQCGAAAYIPPRQKLVY